MRDIKILLQIVIDSLKKGHKKGYYNYGICGEIHDLRNLGIISSKESHYITSIMIKNKPSSNNIFIRYMNNEYWLGGSWWWNTMYFYPETRQLRIDYLNHLKESL